MELYSKQWLSTARRRMCYNITLLVRDDQCWPNRHRPAGPQASVAKPTHLCCDGATGQWPNSEVRPHSGHIPRRTSESRATGNSMRLVPFEPEVRNRTRGTWHANFGFGALVREP